MAVTIGFSEPYVAKYSFSGGNVTYSGGMKLGRGVNMTFEANIAEDNDFYADDVVAESETGAVTSLNGTMTIDGMEPEVAAFVLGLPEATKEEINEEQVDVYDYDDRMNAPYLGLGGLRMVQMNGVKYWEPWVLTKVKISIPNEEMNTKENQIDWQTQEIPVPILRDDTANRRWKRVFARQATKAAALKILKGYLKIVEA